MHHVLHLCVNKRIKVFEVVLVNHYIPIKKTKTDLTCEMGKLKLTNFFFPQTQSPTKMDSTASTDRPILNCEK